MKFDRCLAFVLILSGMVLQWAISPADSMGIELEKVSVRDYLAGCALAGTLASGNLSNAMDSARIAYGIADMTLRFRDKK